MLDNYRKGLENTVKIIEIHRNDLTWTFVVKLIFIALSMKCLIYEENFVFIKDSSYQNFK